MVKQILLGSQMVKIDQLVGEIASTTNLSIQETLEFMWQVVCDDESFPVYTLGEGLPYKLDPTASCQAFANGLDLMEKEQYNHHVFMECAFTPHDATRMKEVFEKALAQSGNEGRDHAGSKSYPEPPYLDPNHPRYAPKLAAAVRAWLAIEENGSTEGRSPKQVITQWLTKHAKELSLLNSNGKPSESGIEEIAKVANWKLQGGAPKTPTKS